MIFSALRNNAARSNRAAERRHVRSCQSAGSWNGEVATASASRATGTSGWKNERDLTLRDKGPRSHGGRRRPRALSLARLGRPERAPESGDGFWSGIELIGWRWHFVLAPPVFRLESASAACRSAAERGASSASSRSEGARLRIAASASASVAEEIP